VTLMLAVFALAASANQAQSSPISFDTATIDGTLSAGEWDNAETWSVFSGAYAGSTLYMMNDLNNLYIALSVIDSTLANNDIMEVRFDNANNGVSDVGDDELFLSILGGFSDTHFSGASWGIPDATDGTGALQGFGTFNVFEMSHPLASGDAFDFNLSAGDTVGFCLRYFDDGLATNSTIFNPAVSWPPISSRCTPATSLQAPFPSRRPLHCWASDLWGSGSRDGGASTKRSTRRHAPIRRSLRADRPSLTPSIRATRREFR